MFKSYRVGTVFGFPIDRASEIAVRETATFLAAATDFDSVLLVAFQEDVAENLHRALTTAGLRGTEPH